MGRMKRRVEFVSIDPADVEAIREWAELRCKGLSLEDLAKSVEVSPTVEAVAAYLGRGLPEESSNAVRVVCERHFCNERTD